MKRLTKLPYESRNRRLWARAPHRPDAPVQPLLYGEDRRLARGAARQRLPAAGGAGSLRARQSRASRGGRARQGSRPRSRLSEPYPARLRAARAALAAALARGWKAEPLVADRGRTAGLRAARCALAQRDRRDAGRA